MKRRSFHRRSGQVSLLLLRALALLAVPAFSALPQRPGGPPGGPGGGWALSYNTHGGAVTVGGSSMRWDDRILTDANGWYSSPNSVGGYDHLAGTHPETSASPVRAPPVFACVGPAPAIRRRRLGSWSPRPQAGVPAKVPVALRMASGTRRSLTQADRRRTARALGCASSA